MTRLLEVKSGPRIRISSLDPFEIPDGLIEMLSGEEKLCPHFHIALQSGSDKILSSMRRIYKAHEFYDVTKKIENANPDTFIGVDVIVGFPGESDIEFEETINLLSQSFWAKLHVFSFSEREGTAAACLSDKVAPRVIDERSEILRAYSDRRHDWFLESQVGKAKQVLLERPSKKRPGIWLGHTENYLPTYSEAPTGAEREIVPSLVLAREGNRVLTRALSSSSLLSE